MKRKLINWGGLSRNRKRIEGTYLGKRPHSPIGNDSLSVEVFKLSEDVLGITPLH